MRRALAIIVSLFLLGCNTSFAQMAPAPGMGTTSPLGSTFSNTSSQPSGIPLGSNELNIGGLSPITGGSSCAGAATNTTGLATTSAGMGTTSTTFDGGGTMSSSAVSTCDTSSSAANSAATPITAGTTAVGSPTTVGTTTGSAARGVIPLGSTELGTPGESPTIAPPTVSIAPCGNTAATMTAPGTTSPTGC